MSDEAMVEVYECTSDPTNCWELTSSRGAAARRITSQRYAIPAGLWEVYRQAATTLAETEAAIDLYVEISHDETDEWSHHG